MRGVWIVRGCGDVVVVVVKGLFKLECYRATMRLLTYSYSMQFLAVHTPLYNFSFSCFVLV